MFVRTDPFRDLDRLTQQVFGTAARPAFMPMDAWKDGDTFRIQLDLPGIDRDSIQIDVERNVMTIRADRPMTEGTHELLASERPRGVFSRQIVLGDTLDLDRIDAEYADGVLSLAIPVSESAKPRRIEIRHGSSDQAAISA